MVNTNLTEIAKTILPVFLATRQIVKYLNVDNAGQFNMLGT